MCLHKFPNIYIYGKSYGKWVEHTYKDSYCPYYFFMSHSFFEEVHIDRQLVHSRPRWNKETILFLKNSLRPLVPLSFFTLYNCKEYNTPTISQRKPILAKKQEKRLQNQRWVEKFIVLKSTYSTYPTVVTLMSLRPIADFKALSPRLHLIPLG